MSNLLAIALDQPPLPAQLEPIGGQLKVLPEDFVVEEIPLDQPCGSGDHLYLWVEKRGLSTLELVRHVGQVLGLHVMDVGYAGMKDAHAVTRQWISVPQRGALPLEKLDGDGVRVLRTEAHDTKLRTGRLEGNRFEILIRHARSDAATLASWQDHLIGRGFANYFGAQRFGREGETLDQGLGALSKKWRGGTSRERRLGISAVQSCIFNSVLAARVRAGTYGAVQPGDLVLDAHMDKPTWAIDLEHDQRRVDTRRAAITGPMVGAKMRWPKHEVLQLERLHMARAGVSDAMLHANERLMPGARRSLVVHPRELSVAPHAEGVRVQCVLPPGTYVTVMLAGLVG